MPRLANKYRNSTSKRIFFAEWETYFLLAEASVRGWNVSMSAKNAYEAGVKASFAYHGAGFVSEYLASTDYNRVGTSVAWDHTAEPSATVAMKYIDGYTKTAGTYTYRYPEMKSRLYTKAMNDHLTKIITQKFIANTPWLPLETWNDFRRLGLPFFETPAVEKALDNMPQLTSSTSPSTSSHSDSLCLAISSTAIDRDMRVLSRPSVARIRSSPRSTGLRRSSTPSSSSI